MMSKLGKELPPCTKVYAMSWYPKEFTVDSGCLPHCIFYFDGIWATQTVRKYWEKHPQRHPHVTLFDILRKNLEIWQ